jgi:phosphate transport system permease protein
MIAIVLVATALPIAIATAVYLEEFAPKERWWIRLIELNIQNLAAIPSIIFGILGLAFLVRGLGLGPVLLAGALILGLQMLPTVIISAREALRAVPASVRQGGMALGATRLQVVWREVLPAAIPGIATGSILGLSRAIGETAPLLMVGAATFVSYNPGLLTQYTVLPILIYQWIKLPQADFQGLAAAAIIILLAILITMNGFAIWMRNRFERKW